MKNISVFAVLLSMVFSQTTITIEDLQYEIGGYYKMYNIPSPQGVIGLTDIQGGPHIFDFSEGVTSDSLIIDYVDVNDGGQGGDFPNATIAERITNESGFAWMYLDFLSGTGRKNFGFYDEIGVPDSPSVPFSPPIIDFPDNLSYQSYFSGTTNFDVFMSGLDINIEYEFSGFADAYGTVILPGGLGEHECIQINYEEQYTYNWMGTPIQYSYLRSYYYLAEDLGIVAIITSLEEENPVPNGFNIANTFARMFDSSKIVFSGILGDVNNDGALNVLDIVLTVNIILEQHTPSDYEFWAADVNADGAINVMDIIQIVGLIMQEG